MHYTCGAVVWRTGGVHYKWGVVGDKGGIHYTCGVVVWHRCFRLWMCRGDDFTGVSDCGCVEVKRVATIKGLH